MQINLKLMANITFRLNNGGKTPEDKPSSIYLRYKYGRGLDFNKSIGLRVNPKNWNSDKQNVKNRSEVLNRQLINEMISNLRNHFETFEISLISKGEKPTKKLAEKHFKTFYKEPEKEDSKLTLLKYIADFQKRPDIIKNRSEGTLKNYRLTEKFLQRFNDEVYLIDFDNINMDFYNNFIEWAESQKLSKNYIGKHLNTLKTFLTNATHDKINTNLEFQNQRFKILKEDAQNIYLSLEELSKIHQADYKKHPKLDQARDLFLIGAYTGLRVSDFNYLKAENIITNKGNKFLKVKTKKTNKEVVIPLRQEVIEILEKHGDKPPQTMPDQHINYKIKEVCEDVGIDETVYTEQTLGGKISRTKNFKFDLVKTHTARRSFCTNAYLSGMPTIDIMQISGHSSEKTFLKYIKADALQKAVKISSHSFFKGENEKLKLQK
jgi:integrase